MSSATAAVVAVGLAIAVFAGPLYRYVERAAVELDAPATVASGDARPDGEAGGR